MTGSSISFRIEHHAVARRETAPHLLEHGWLQRLAGAQVPGRRQPRFAQALVVHAAHALLPVAGGENLLEERVGA
jgi:hypothetical protein